MNATAEQIAAMLARKTEIDRMPSFEKRNITWLFDAVELLLRIELERQEGAAEERTRAV